MWDVTQRRAVQVNSDVKCAVTHQKEVKNQLHFVGELVCGTHRGASTKSCFFRWYSREQRVPVSVSFDHGNEPSKMLVHRRELPNKLNVEPREPPHYFASDVTPQWTSSVEATSGARHLLTSRPDAKEDSQVQRGTRTPRASVAALSWDNEGTRSSIRRELHNGRRNSWG